MAVEVDSKSVTEYSGSYLKAAEEGVQKMVSELPPSDQPTNETLGRLASVICHSLAALTLETRGLRLAQEAAADAAIRQVKILDQ